MVAPLYPRFPKRKSPAEVALQDLGPDMWVHRDLIQQTVGKNLAVQVTKGEGLTGLSHAGRTPPPICA